MNPIILCLSPAARASDYIALAARRQINCINYNRCLDFVVSQLSDHEHRRHGWACPDNCAYYVEYKPSQVEISVETAHCYSLLEQLVKAGE